MDFDFRAYFEQYAQAYDAFDAQGIASFCHAPCITVRNGVATAHATTADVAAFFSPMLEQYKANGYYRGIIRRVEVSPAGSRGAYAIVGWDIQRADGSSMRVFETSYNLFKTESGWKLLLIMNHD